MATTASFPDSNLSMRDPQARLRPIDVDLGAMSVLKSNSVKCDSCGLLCHNLDDFIEHRNTECRNGEFRNPFSDRTTESSDHLLNAIERQNHRTRSTLPSLGGNVRMQRDRSGWQGPRLGHRGDRVPQARGQDTTQGVRHRPHHSVWTEFRSVSLCSAGPCRLSEGCELVHGQLGRSL